MLNSIAKFGGSSLATKESFDRVNGIVRDLKDGFDRKIVVVSALGKRFSGDEKITDLLIDIYNNKDLQRKKTVVYDRFLHIAEYFGCRKTVVGELDGIFRMLDKGVDYDWFVSRGEYVTAEIVSEMTGYPFIDAYDVLKLKGRSLYYTDRTENAVIGGFYCDGGGKVKLLGRGGSDVTGAVISKSLGYVYENFTDVSGIKRATPKILPDAPTACELTYDEVLSLSKCGAEVYAERAVYPLLTGNTVTYIKNTFNPTGEFTKLSSESHGDGVDVITLSHNGVAVIGEGLVRLNLKERIKEITGDCLFKEYDDGILEIVTSDAENTLLYLYNSLIKC